MMIVFQLILYHRTIVYVTETSSKMVSTLTQKWLTIFCQKAHNFGYFEQYDLVQISPGCDQNTYQIRHVSISNNSIKSPIGKSFFAVNLPINSSVLPLQMVTLEV